MVSEAQRRAGQCAEAARWGQARRPLCQMADPAATARRRAQGKTLAVISPLALEAVRRIDALFEIERSINGQSAERRRAVRLELSAPVVADLESWLREQRPKLSRGNDLAKARDYMLKRWPAFTRFLDDGRICLSNNGAHRLGGAEAGLHDLSIDMYPEAGCLWVYGVGEDGVPAFTQYGIECRQQIIADERTAGRAPPQVKPTE